MAEQDERAKFVAAMGRIFAYPINTRTHDDGRYGDHYVQQLWLTWQAARAPSSETRGTFACPICGKETPHRHDERPTGDTNEQ